MRGRLWLVHRQEREALLHLAGWLASGEPGSDGDIRGDGRREEGLRARLRWAVRASDRIARAEVRGAERHCRG